MGALFSMIERKGRKVNENINILVAEDDPDINRLIGKILRNAGYEVISAFSGTEAAMCLEMKAFDLLLLDLMMPGMDGERLLTELREKKGMNTPVLILSAKAALADKVRLLTEGADDYMTKPFEPEELLARVGAILRRSHKKEEKADEVLKHKNLRLYPASHQIRVCGQEISLTKHEFELLHEKFFPEKCCMSRSGRAGIMVKIIVSMFISAIFERKSALWIRRQNISKRSGASVLRYPNSGESLYTFFKLS